MRNLSEEEVELTLNMLNSVGFNVLTEYINEVSNNLRGESDSLCQLATVLEREQLIGGSIHLSSVLDNFKREILNHKPTE